MNERIARLVEILGKRKIYVEENIEALTIISDIGFELGEKEVIVKEPADINDDVKMNWTEAQLKGLRELAVVAIANEMGIDASIRDYKADTIAAILKKQSES